MRFTNIKAVLSRLPVDKSQFNEDDFIEWSMQGLDLLNVKRTYQREGVLIEVKNHKAELPCDLLQIELVTTPLLETNQDFLNSKYVQELEDCGCGFNAERISTIEKNGNIRIIANYPLFEKTSYFQNNFIILSLSNTPFAGKYHCESCPNLSSTCDMQYTLHSQGYITVPFESGYICIGYLKHATDENGDYLIPDNEDLILFLTNYTMAKHWEERMNMKEEGASQLYMLYMNKAENNMGRARGTFISKDFNFNSWKNIVYKNINKANHYSIFNKQSRYER